MTSSKGTSYPFRSAFEKQLRRRAEQYHAAKMEASRHQWMFAKELLAEWNAGEYEGEITKDEYYAEASRLINDVAGFALVSTSGETVKVWCEVFAQFVNAPDVLKEQLPFAYFRNARYLYNAGKVAIPMAAIATALDHRLTASEMLRWYNDPPVIDPQILELRQAYPQFLWGLVDVLPRLNGVRGEVEGHAREIVRLVEIGA